MFNSNPGSGLLQRCITFFFYYYPSIFHSDRQVESCYPHFFYYYPSIFIRTDTWNRAIRDSIFRLLLRYVEFTCLGYHTVQQYSLSWVSGLFFDRKSTHATIEVRHFFSDVPQFGSLRPLPQTASEKNQNHRSNLPDEKIR